MAVNKVPVLKRCRSLGLEPSYLGYDKKSNRELKRANKKVSEYGLQLREKQKAKFIYGVLEKPFRNYYDKADQMKGMTGTNLMTILESRLDNVIFRLGFARTRREARQIVDHKFVTVNGKLVNIPSYLVKAGDVIEIKESRKNSQRMKDVVEVAGGRLVPEWLDVDAEKMQGTVKELPSREMIDVIEIKESRKNSQRMKDVVEVAGGRLVPEWLDVDAEKMQGTVKELPSREMIDVPVDEMLIVELYSK